MTPLERQTRQLVRDAAKVERDSKLHLARAEEQLMDLRAEEQLMDLMRCRNCGFRFSAHDEVDGRCPNPDGTL